MESPIKTDDLLETLRQEYHEVENIYVIPVEGGFKRVPKECSMGDPAPALEEWWMTAREEVAMQELLILQKVTEAEVMGNCLRFAVATGETPNG